MSADTLPAIWSQFTSGAADPVSAHAVHGAVSASALVPAGGNATLTIVFGWHFPTRESCTLLATPPLCVAAVQHLLPSPWLYFRGLKTRLESAGYFASKPIGNYYATALHADAASAAIGLGSRLGEVVGIVEGWHAAIFDPNDDAVVPVWLQARINRLPRRL